MSESREQEEDNLFFVESRYDDNIEVSVAGILLFLVSISLFRPSTHTNVLYC